MHSYVQNTSWYPEPRGKNGIVANSEFPHSTQKLSRDRDEHWRLTSAQDTTPSTDNDRHLYRYRNLNIMPAPVVYFVFGVVTVVAVGFAFKELVYDPWREERRARREARRLVPPHSTHEASQPTRTTSTHEMRDLGRSTTEGRTTSTDPDPSSGLRNRRNNASTSNIGDSTVPAPGPIDAPNADNISFRPLTPDTNPWSGGQTPSPPTLSPSPFEVGSDSATLSSESPTLPDHSLSATRAPSPLGSDSPPIQLPTPAESIVIEPSSPQVHPDLLEWSQVSPSSSVHDHLPTPSTSETTLLDQTLSPDLHPDLFATSMSRTTTDMSASFMTARSPETEFGSFPPTEQPSPFSDAFALSASGDESVNSDMYSTPSHSSESLPVFAAPEDEGGHAGGLMFVVGNTAGQDTVAGAGAGAGTTGQDDPSDNDDSSSEGSDSGSSDESWEHAYNENWRDDATSPRH